jgi:predicted dehydrogenase
MSQRTRYAQVGLGGRHEMFRNSVIGKYSDHCEMVALCDTNQGRLDLSLGAVRAKTGTTIPGYAAADFDRMIAETKPDCVIVTTRDCHHDEYICRAMELGCDVISEKPMTTDEVKCQKIIDTRKKTGRKCTVTFNYRYGPARTQVKDILMSGAIGEILSMDFHWLLDTQHGADYFRRWHRNKTYSGSLLVHKATHHFDVINWWLSDVPETVYAEGNRSFYTPQTAERYGLTRRGPRCLDCPEAERCPFFLDLKSKKTHAAMYLECEQYDNYWRDKCVFDFEGDAYDPAIDIEDNVVATIRYKRGTVVSYSLINCSPWEGSIVSINGTRGRLETVNRETSYVSGDGSVPGEQLGSSITIIPRGQAPEKPKIWSGKGGHGGADPVMQDYIFAPDTLPEDKYLRAADYRAGVYSILCGVAANKSMLEKRPIRIGKLVTGLEMPDFPPMPTDADPLPLFDNSL